MLELNHLIFNIDSWLAANPGRAHPAVFFHADEHAALTDELVRTISPWGGRVSLAASRCAAEVAEATGWDGEASVCFVLDKPGGLTHETALSFSRARNIPLVDTMLPPIGSDGFAFYQEFESHNFELGGLNEWNGNPGIYSSSILQSFSLVHCSNIFPHFVLPDLLALRERLGNGALQTLDVGCGSISKARWGAVTGLLSIVGVDPLNDLYDAIFARHGLDALPDLRPVRRIRGFAEDCGFEGEFDFVFSCNALDHTQDIVRSFATIRAAMKPFGIACIMLNTREGLRQDYQGLHKYDVWVADGELRCSSRLEAPFSLLEAAGGFDILSIGWTTDQSFAVLLKRKD